MVTNRRQYYDGLKARARELRSEHNIVGYALNKTILKRVCKDCGVGRIDLWPPTGSTKLLKKLRGAYFTDECGCSIMVSRSLPNEPAIFTYAHELKHHLVDQHLLSGDNPALFCDQSNFGEEIEIGAEIFAAEFLYPENEFLGLAEQMGIHRGECKPDDLVRLKKEANTVLSYAALAKRSEYFDLSPDGTLSKFRGWKKLEEQLFGEPPYKRFLRR